MEAAESLIEAKNSGISSSLIITNAEVWAACTIASKGNRENAGLSRTVNPSQGVRCIVASVRGDGSSSSDPEDALRSLDPIAGAPSGHEGAREGGVEEIDRQGVVEHSPHPRWRHGPSVGTAILVEPACHLREAPPEPFRRDANANTDRIARGLPGMLRFLFVLGRSRIPAFAHQASDTVPGPGVDGPRELLAAASE